MKRKLIEVALPLEAINRESAREKSIRHGHPSTLHLWWARRPLAAARAALFAQLVDDPSARIDEFPTEESQRAERERLHKIIERLVVWENVRDDSLLAEAHSEILKSCGGNLPSILDPFAGGGTIPLEAHRLGLESHASDLNPVAVLINKALIEIPPKFRGQRPVFSGLAESQIRTWRGIEGLAADVRAYGAWMRNEAEKRIGSYYPEVTLPGGARASAVAWIWTRTVTCPNPACGIEMPLTRTWWLRKKKGRNVYVVPSVVQDVDHSSGMRVVFELGYDDIGAPTSENDGTVGRSGAACCACKASVDLKYIRTEGESCRLGQQLIAIVADGKNQRVYLPPDRSHVLAAMNAVPEEEPDGNLPIQALGFRIQGYGMRRFSDLFTKRQLLALITFSDLISEAREAVLKDALHAGFDEGQRLDVGGNGAVAYADAVATYLAMALSKMADRGSSIVTWFLGRESTRNTFARQAIPMTWDFVEANQFGRGTGSWSGAIEWTAESMDGIPAANPVGRVTQADASARDMSVGVIHTDPPYYDNIGYADLSDFFYVWLRRSLRSVYPQLLSTMLVPKAEELVANPHRHGGNDGAKRFFEEGFQRVFARARSGVPGDYPAVVWYAFKQADNTDDGTASSGWETLLEGMIRSGWSITSTWPMRSELGNRVRGQESNALASSIVLALRPRSNDSPTVDRRGLISALQAELPEALRKLQQGAIAPVDLPQAAIGPGMAVFSRFAKVLEPDGSQMTVRSALARINEILDQVLSEQEGDFDATTRFAIAWYRQHGYNTGTFGDADNLARARNTSVERMDRDGILTSRAGKVALIKPTDSPDDYDVVTDDYTSTWETLHHTIRILESEGVPAAGAFLAAAQARPGSAVDPDLIKELAFLLFSVAEKNGWAKDAISFNTVAQSWGDVVGASKTAPARHVQTEIDYLEAEY